MKKYFKELTTVFKSYKDFENSVNEEFENAKKSGRYTRGYLQKIALENQGKIDKQRKVVQARYATIRDELEKEIESTNSINGAYISDSLVKLLNSPIQLTEAEYSRLARIHKDSVTNSRLLHDSAAARGLVLENYTTNAEIMEKFDLAVEHLNKSMFLNRGELPFYPDVKFAQNDIGKLCGEVATHSFECYKRPTTLEEAMNREALLHAREHEAELARLGKAFVEGFTGKPYEEIKNPMDILTEVEKLDAKVYSWASGRGGEITDADIEHVRHDIDYVGIRSDNPLPVSVLKKYSKAIDAAIAAQEKAEENGQEHYAATQTGLEAFKSVMNSPDGDDNSGVQA